MKKIMLFILAAMLPLNIYAETVKKTDLAGSWYPSSKDVLSSELDGYLNSAKVEPVKGDVKAIIAPHAGLVFAGPVAAYGYNAVRGKKYSTVLVLGFCHRYYFDGISVYNEGSFETPLGPLEIDKETASYIISGNKKIVFNPKAFSDENSIELELPFIKKVLPEAKIVPIAFGSSEYSYAEIIAEILAKVIGGRDDILLVASTDMSHYLTYEEARQKDSKSIELLKAFDAKGIYGKAISGDQLFCGYMPVAAALLTCKKIGADKIAILHYANSGDITGDKTRVVGYVSAVIYKAEELKNAESASERPADIGGGAQGGKEENKGDVMLSVSQRKRLLELARNTIKTYLETGKVLEVKEDDPVFNREMGAFVTLHEKGELRGCIGNIIGRGPLYLTVRNMAIESATGDPRFPKVTLGELSQIDIEISVLSELKKIKDVNEIQMGVHGVLVRKGFSSGVFLPQVATETGWSREEFLTNLCAHKAGLMPDAWKTGGIDIYIFTAEVFGEKE